MLLQYRDIEGDRVDDSLVTFVSLLSHQLLLIYMYKYICLNDSNNFLIIRYVSKYFCDTIYNCNIIIIEV